MICSATRIVPGQHDHHRAELNVLCAASEVGEHLEYVRTHRVVGEMVLDAPQGLETERLGHIAET
jgi:hypothetical protein